MLIKSRPWRKHRRLTAPPGSANVDGEKVACERVRRLTGVDFHIGAIEIPMEGRLESCLRDNQKKRRVLCLSATEALIFCLGSACSAPEQCSLQEPNTVACSTCIPNASSVATPALRWVFYSFSFNSDGGSYVLS